MIEAIILIAAKQIHQKRKTLGFPECLSSILLIAAILYFVDLRAMLDAIRNANYGSFRGIALVIGFIWMAVRLSLRCRLSARACILQ